MSRKETFRSTTIALTSVVAILFVLMGIDHSKHGWLGVYVATGLVGLAYIIAAYQLRIGSFDPGDADDSPVVLVPQQTGGTDVDHERLLLRTKTLTVIGLVAGLFLAIHALILGERFNNVAFIVFVLILSLARAIANAQLHKLRKP